MFIERKASGFYEWDADARFDRPHAIGVESARAAECMAHYNEVGAGGLFGNPTFGFHGSDLEFLRLARVKPRWIWFWDVEIQNLDALYLLEELDYFGIHPARPGIDFSRFRRFDKAMLHWNKRDTGIAQSPICVFHLWHFKPRSKSFADVEIPRNVEHLDLTFANPAGLEGLPLLERLTHLEIHRCSKLSDLSALPRIAPNLRTLLATNSKRLVPGAGVLDHPKLRSARIAGKEYLAADP